MWRWRQRSSSQGSPVTASKPPEARGEEWNGFFFRPSEDTDPANTLIWLATSNTERQYTSVVEATQCEVLTQSLNRHKWDSLWYFGHIFHLAFIKVQNNLSALQNFADPHLITVTTGRKEKQAEVCMQKHGLSSEDTEGALLNLGLFPKRLKKGNHI